MSTIRLTSTQHKPLKTTLVQKNGDTLYRLETQKSVTTLYRHRPGETNSSEPIATLERYVFKDNIINFVRGRSILQKELLHKPSSTALTRDRVFDAPNGRTYRWNNDWKLTTLELTLADKTVSSEVFAKFHPDKRRSRHMEAAYLEISSSIMSILDFVVLTWVIMEKRRQLANHHHHSG